MSKYDTLKIYLRQAEESALTLRFAEIEQILGFDLPASAYKYASWWANSASGGAHMRAWRDAGWEVSGVDLSGRRVRFRRRSGQPVKPVDAGSVEGKTPAAQASPPRSAPAERGAVSREKDGPAAARAVSSGGATSGKATPAPAASAIVPEETVDVSRLPPQARRLLEMKGRGAGRSAAAEAARILSRALQEERRRLAQRLVEIRGRTMRPGGFDLLDVLGRHKGGEGS